MNNQQSSWEIEYTWTKHLDIPLDSSLPLTLDILYLILTILKIRQVNIFKAPEVPKKITPEEKVHEAVPKKPEVPPPKGTHQC